MWLQKFRKGSWLVVSLVALGVVLQSCMKNNDDDVYDAYKILNEDIVTIKEYLASNGIDAVQDSFRTDGSGTGIFYQLHEEGEGYKALQGVELEFQYQGQTLDGVEFVNNFGSNAITITLGNSDTYPTSVTAAVAIGFSLMQEGDSMTVYAPSPYGFQDQGYQDVPPNSILVYTIKFLDIKKLSEEYEKIDQYIVDNNMTAAIDPVYGARYVIHRVGNNITPDRGAFISTHYQGELLDGTVFDTSYDSGSPLGFTYGNGELIPGFELGISNLHENDSATIFVPSIYGYGDSATGEIPANSVLVFGLDIIRISNPI